MQLQVPLRAAHHSGVLRLVSGGDGVHGLQHDQVRATLRYPGAPGTASRPRSATVTLHRVVKDQLTRPLTAH